VHLPHTGNSIATVTPARRLDTVDVSLLLLRLGIGGLMLSLHGWARFLRASEYVLHGADWPFIRIVTRLGFPAAGAFAVASAAAESIGSLLVLAGLFTRAAAAFIAIDMAVAVYNELNGGDPQLPGLYLLGALVIVIAGPGRFALDRLRRGPDTSRARRSAEHEVDRAHQAQRRP
jgi:putative oxidoreductase